MTKVDFVENSTHEARIQFLNELSDAVRGLRREAIKADSVKTAVETATLGWTDPTQAEVVTAMEDGTSNMPINLGAKFDEITALLS